MKHEGHGAPSQILVLEREKHNVLAFQTLEHGPLMILRILMDGKLAACFKSECDGHGGTVEICAMSGGDGSMTLRYAFQEGMEISTQFRCVSR